NLVDRETSGLFPLVGIGVQFVLDKVADGTADLVVFLSKEHDFVASCYLIVCDSLPGWGKGSIKTLQPRSCSDAAAGAPPRSRSPAKSSEPCGCRGGRSGRRPTTGRCQTGRLNLCRAFRRWLSRWHPASWDRGSCPS